MLKRFFVVAFCLLFAVCLASCDFAYNGQSGAESNDPSIEKFEVRQEQRFAPCSFFNFIYGNEQARNYFVDSLTIPFGQIMWQSVKIDGEEWGDAFFEKFPEGRYKVEIVATIPFSEVNKKIFIVRVNVSRENEDITGGIDYLAETLTLTERHVGEQALFSEFLDSNFHYRAYLWYALYSVSTRNPWEYVLIDGEKWEHVDLVLNELPIGQYDIVIKVSEDFVVRKKVDNGEVIEIKYPRMLTIPVQVKEKL